MVPILAVVALVLHVGRSDDVVAPATVGSKPAVVAASAMPPGSADSIPASGGGGVPAPASRNPGTVPPGSGSGSPGPNGGGVASIAGAPATESKVVPPSTAGGPIVAVRNGERIEVFDEPGGDLVARQGDETEFGSKSVFSVLRVSEGWVGVSTHLLPNGELGWIRADPGKLRAGYVDDSIVVDLSERSAKLYHGEAQVRSWTVTVGAADSETPTGEFAVTDEIRGGLDPAYGCCAVAISATQPDPPPGWVGGNRIAFHGTDGPLGVAASNGCLRSTDEDVSALLGTVPLGTPVRIRE